VRVSAQNSQGFGLPSAETSDSTDTPLAVPEEPAEVQLERAPGAAAGSSLRVVWLDPADDRGSLTTHFTIQWRPVGAAEGVEPELALSDEQIEAAWTNSISHTGAVSSFRDTARRNPGQPDGNEYVIEGLNAGIRYAVRVAAGNSRGFGSFLGSVPPTEVPREAAMAPSAGDVTLRIREAGGSVDVAASATSLEVSWVPPSGAQSSAQTVAAVLGAGTGVGVGGFSAVQANELPSYLVEYSRSSFSDSRPDTQVLQLNTTGVRGTFRLSLYSEQTVPLPFDATAAEL